MDTPNPSRQRKNLQKRTKRAEKNRQEKIKNPARGTYIRGWGKDAPVSSETNHHRTNKKTNRNRFPVKAKHKRRIARKP